jgi:linoleate 10R-lipoxygenase
MHSRFYIASEDVDRAERERRAMINALVGAPGALNKLTKYFYDKTRSLIAEETWTTVGATTKNVNIVRDVLKHVPIHWAAEVVSAFVVMLSSRRNR